MWSLEHTPLKTCAQSDWTMCLEVVNHKRLDNQHNWGNLYGHLLTSFAINIHMSSKTNEENNPDMDLYVNNNDNIFM